MSDRYTADTINDDALDALYDEIDRLRAGEEDGYDPLTVPTPGQWIHQFNQATAEKRLEVVGRLIDAAERVWACTMNLHEERIHDGRHAVMALNEVRDVVTDMEATTGARTWAGWLRDAMKRGPKYCLLCATEPKPESGQVATGPDDNELTTEEARALADELGLDLYRAQDALAFVGECCDIADREKRAVTTADVREWLKGARCGRQLAADAAAATQATERTEEQNLVHALGGDRTAQTIAHTLTVHGHTLNAVRTMTYAELLAVPGIGGTSLARIRAALDGVPEPDAAATTEPAGEYERTTGHAITCTAGFTDTCTCPPKEQH